MLQELSHVVLFVAITTPGRVSFLFFVSFLIGLLIIVLLFVSLYLFLGESFIIVVLPFFPPPLNRIVHGNVHVFVYSRNLQLGGTKKQPNEDL